MTIKRKTHLNLSGSHHTLDSDNGFIGGLLYVTGSVTASVGVSASLVQGTNGLFANLTGSISSTSDGNPFIVGGSDIVVNYNSLGQWELSGSEAGFFSSPSNGVIRTTGSLEATYLSASTGAQITGSLQVLGGITGSISGTTGGLPFLISGGNMDAVSYNNATGQWTITGPTATTPAAAGSDTQVQFNQNGVFAASSSFTFFSGTLGTQVLSGTMPSSSVYYGKPPFSNLGEPFSGSALVVKTPLIVSQSFITIDGTGDQTEWGGGALTNGGLYIQNGGVFAYNSGTIVDSGGVPAFSLQRVQGNGLPWSDWISANGPSIALVQGAGVFEFYSGSYNGAGNNPGVAIYPGLPYSTKGSFNPFPASSETQQPVDFFVNGFNVRPLWTHATSSQASFNTVMSHSVLTDAMSNIFGPIVAKIDFNVVSIANETGGGALGEYGTWLISATVVKNTNDIIQVIGYDEISSFVTGSGAQLGLNGATPWDVNIRSDGAIEVTGSSYTSSTSVYWYAQVTKQMAMDGSGTVRY